MRVFNTLVHTFLARGLSISALHKLHKLLTPFRVYKGGAMSKGKFLTKVLNPVIERFLIASYGVYVKEKESGSEILDYESFALAVKGYLESEEK